MYKGRDEKKDGAYTIFYMGVNAGAFLGILLCGYLGEKSRLEHWFWVSWNFYAIWITTILVFTKYIWQYWLKNRPKESKLQEAKK